MSTLVIAEIRQSELRASSYNTIAAAKAKGGDFDILLLGKGSAAGADALKEFGAGTVYYSEADAVAEYTAESYAKTVAALVGEKGYTAVMMGATTTGKDMIPRLGGLLGAGMVSDVIGFDGANYLRPMFAGNAIATVEVNTPVAVMTVRETAFDAAAPSGGVSAVAEATAVGDDRAKFIEYRLTESSRPDLGAASIIVSAGRGVKDADGVKQVEALADLLGAAVGASRAVVDEGLLPNDLQVGQTGKIVAPDLYIACGISGAIQHVAGMKDSKVIVAINKDEEAPIFEVADYGLVADFAKAIPEFMEKVKAIK
ncbi:MAG: electron transfer flavoprotein subunit alpha [Deltaproteobacteria bacterium]|nr:MAG: electron transfer flavoprotein subunit alpha [Deltaproteobacteria bacterium]